MEFFTKNGNKKVVIGIADWQYAKRLQNAILRGVAQQLGGKAEVSGLPDLIALVAMVDSSPEFEAALWPCLQQCLYDDEKITQQLFNAAAPRQDYYEIVQACAKENLGPLAASLLSLLPAGIGSILGLQRSESPE